MRAWLAVLGVFAAVIAVLVLIALTGPAASHPGRLDQTGCHTVRKPGGFTYKSGKVAPEGCYESSQSLDIPFWRNCGPNRISRPEPTENLTRLISLRWGQSAPQHSDYGLNATL